MYDILDLASGETVVELGTQDDVRGFFCDLFPVSDFSRLELQEVIKLLDLQGYRVYQID